MSRLAILVAAAASVSVSTTQAEVVIETVAVGDPGNNDYRGFGVVEYFYDIGKYEVTNAQYAEFLNAVAASDPHGLYNSEEMGIGYGGITRSVDPPYTYDPIAGREDMPVNYVSWYDALRFANWMHNGQGSRDTEDGAYDMSLGASVSRKPGATVFLPTENEWYKAAYYKGGGLNAGYWDYPTQADCPPTPEPPPGTDMICGSANYFLAAGDLTGVGAYDERPSGGPYGTFDQGGNVWEWNEEDLYGDGFYRGIRGGAYDSEDAIALFMWFRATWPHLTGPLNEYASVGFRVATPFGTCGDGVLTFGEDCDDGNTDPSDGCSPICTIPAPAVSTWGLAVLTLLIVATATVLIRRQRQTVS